MIAGEQLELFTNGEIDEPESSGSFLNRVKDNGAKWAHEFRKTSISLGYSDMDEGWLICWFANAIEHSSDVRRWRGEKNPSEIYAWMQERCITWPMDKESKVLFELTWGDYGYTK